MGRQSGLVRRSCVTPCRPISRGGDDESGLTLVELLVAIIIIGILFAGVGAFLMNSLRTTVINERRVQSTAMVNRINEELQNMPWDRAGLYRHELVAESATMAELGIDPTAEPPMYDGEQVVLVEYPCDPIAACDRDEYVPEPVRTITVDDREYTVTTVVTRANDVGPGEVALRFTIIVEWDVFTRTVSQELQSLRSPTAGELEEFGPPIPVFNIAPTTVGLNESDMTTQPIDLQVDFNGSVDDVEVEYFQLDADGDPVGPSDTIELTKVSGAPDGFSWQGQVPSDIGPYEVGTLTLRMVARHGADQLVSERSVQLIDESELAGTPTVTNVSVNRSTVMVGNAGPSNDRLCQSLIVTATVENLDPDSGTVTVTYQGDGGTGDSMTPVGPINPAGTTTVELVFPAHPSAGSTSPWDPVRAQGGNPAQHVQVQFQVQAANDGQAGNVQSSAWITAMRENGAC